MTNIRPLIFLGCIALTGCPTQNNNVEVTTDANSYVIESTKTSVTASITNNMNVPVYVDGCNQTSVYKAIINDEIAVDGRANCQDNNVKTVKPGATFESTLEIDSTGDYRVTYQYGLGCSEDSPLSAANCQSISEKSRDIQVTDFCTKEYDPVCGSTLKKVRFCEDGDCKTIEVYKTFGNECTARAAGSPIYFKDACENEGAPVNLQNCPAVELPVCALKMESNFCDTPNVCGDQMIPAPATYRTYSNSCVATNDGANIAFPGACGNIEGATPPPKPQGPQVCTMHYEPVCGIRGLNIKEYSNACRARASGALVMDVEPGFCSKGSKE